VKQVLSPTDYIHPALRECLATDPELMKIEAWRDHIDLIKWRERGRFDGWKRLGHWKAKRPRYVKTYDGKFITKGLPADVISDLNLPS
jgi:hypothetical protein